MQRNPDVIRGSAGWYEDQKFNAFVCRAGQFHFNQEVWRAMKILRREHSVIWFTFYCEGQTGDDLYSRSESQLQRAGSLRVSLAGLLLAGCAQSSGIQQEGRNGAEILSVIQAMIHAQSHFWGWGIINRRKQSCCNLQKGAHELVAVLVAIFWVKQEEVLNEGSSNGIREKGTSSHLSCEFEVLVWKPRELYDTSRGIYVSRN